MTSGAHRLVCGQPSSKSGRRLAVGETWRGRFLVGAALGARGGVSWFSGTDAVTKAPIRIGCEPRAPAGADWPGLAWETRIRRRITHPGLPRVIAHGSDKRHHYLVLAENDGESLWSAWDRSEQSGAARWDLLIQLAEILRALHESAAVVESLSPSQICVMPGGRVALNGDVALAPLPVCPPKSARACISAPEWHRGEPVDAQTDLFHFGSVVCALHLGRELSELDFHSPGEPKRLLEREPEVHPFLGRLIARTFAANRDDRFPSRDATADPTGFGEVIQTLEQAQGVLGRVRLDIAAWTSAGMGRRQNEDALAIMQNTHDGELDCDNWAVIALADGIGGNPAGEVAAHVAVRAIRDSLMRSEPLQALSLTADAARRRQARSRLPEAIQSALNAAHETVRAAARCEAYSGMACTAEALVVDGEQAVVGHVGDSRSYLLRRGELRQLTRDQNLLAKLVDDERLPIEQARRHPRCGELLQAIGGRNEIAPEIVHTSFLRGDWLIVCSDGLTARLSRKMIRSVVETAPSADAAARRLVNLANLYRAPDNVSVVVVRAV